MSGEVQKEPYPHTPGPWSLCGADRDVCKCFMVSCGHHPIAVIEHGAWGDSYPSIRMKAGTTHLDNQWEAYIERMDYGSIDENFAKGNAYLVSAAPDLLEALRKIYSAIDSCVELTPDILKQARAAIDKAEGR